MENTETIAKDTTREAEVATFKPNFDLLSTDATLNGNVEAPKEEIKEEVKTENKPEEVTETEIKLDEEKQSEEVKEEVKETTKEEVKEEKPVEDVLTLDDEVVNEVKEDSWIALAKSQNLEINEDTPEAYKEALIKPYVEQLEQAKTAKVEDYLTEVDPQIRMEIELNKAGLSYEEIKAPLENIAKFRAMNPVELVRFDMTDKMMALRGTENLSEEDKSFIDADIEKKVESGEINHDYKKLMLILDQGEKEHKDYQQYVIDKYKANKDNHIAQKSKEQTESVIKSLNEIKDFMGSPLAPETIKGLTDRFNSGKYNQMFDNPDMRAKFITFIELGEKDVKNIEAKSYNKGKLEIAKELANVPPKTTGLSGTEMTQHKTGNFELLDGDTNLNG